MEPTVAEVTLDDAPNTWVWERVCALAIVVVLFTAVTALIVRRPGHASGPAEQLAQIRKFVKDSRTARFESTDTEESGSAKGGLGSRFEHTTRMTGVLLLPDSSHWTEDSGDFAMEGIVTADALYERHADSVAELAYQQWVKTARPKETLPLPSVGGSVPGAHQFGAVLHAVGAPTDVAIVLEHITNVSQVSPGVIKGTLDLTSLPDFSADEGPVPDVSIELATDPDGRLVRMTSTAITNAPGDEGGKSTSRTEMRFLDWGAPVQIAAPAPDTIDPTPSVDEKGLAAFTAAPVLMPGNLPAAFQLTEASAMKAGEEGDCAEVDLSFADPATLVDSSTSSGPITDEGDNVDTSISVSITAASCDASMVEGGTPATVAGHPARIQHGDVKDGDYAITVEVVVGATRMTVQSDLPDAVVLDAMRRIVPFDLNAVRIYNDPSLSDR